MTYNASLSRLLQQSSSSSESNFSNVFENNSGYFVSCVFAGAGLIMFVICMLKQSSMYTASSANSRRIENLQIESDPEEREVSIARKRVERRAKYSSFLKPYTMVVKQVDLYTHVEEGKPAESASADLHAGDKHTSSENRAYICRPQVAQEYLMLTLPANGPNGAPWRVEANCAICLAEYEVGDSVVRSARKECRHAFHDECILMWLSKGKKRCPICRNFFVPTIPADNKKVVKENVDGTELDVSSTPSDNDGQLYESDEAIIRSLRELRSSARDLEAGRPSSVRGDLRSQRNVHEESV